MTLEFSENWLFLGNEDFVDIFWGDLHKIGLYLAVISMHFMIFSGALFLKLKVQNGGYFWVAKNFKYIFGVLEIPDIFWSER